MLCFLGLVAFARPLFLLRLPRWLRKPRPWELKGTLYRALGVQVFGMLLQRTPLRLLNSQVYLSEYSDDPARLSAQLEAAEAAHLWAAALIAPYMAYACIANKWSVFFGFVGVQIAGNAYPIFHLRWVRGRLERVLERRVDPLRRASLLASAPVTLHARPSPTVSIRGVIFDLFHTLTGPESARAELPKTYEILGIDSVEWNSAVFEHSHWRLAGEIRDPVQIVRTLAHRINPDIPEALIIQAALIRQRRSKAALNSIPIANVQLLSTLRQHGFRLGLISNLDASELAGWSGSPLDGAFDAELFSCEIGVVKPDTAIYVECLKRLGLAAPECIFVGDGGSNELSGARQVGLHTILFSGVIRELWPNRIAALEESADAHVHALSDIMSLPMIRSIVGLSHASDRA